MKDDQKDQTKASKDHWRRLARVLDALLNSAATVAIIAALGALATGYFSQDVQRCRIAVDYLTSPAGVDDGLTQSEINELKDMFLRVARSECDTERLSMTDFFWMVFWIALAVAAVSYVLREYAKSKQSDG